MDAPQGFNQTLALIRGIFDREQENLLRRANVSRDDLEPDEDEGKPTSPLLDAWHALQSLGSMLMFVCMAEQRRDKTERDVLLKSAAKVAHALHMLLRQLEPAVSDSEFSLVTKQLKAYDTLVSGMPTYDARKWRDARRKLDDLAMSAIDPIGRERERLGLR